MRGEAHRAAIRAVLDAFGDDANAFVFVGAAEGVHADVARLWARVSAKYGIAERDVPDFVDAHLDRLEGERPGPRPARNFRSDAQCLLPMRNVDGIPALACASGTPRPASWNHAA